MVRATSRTGLARSSKGGLQYALRRLSRVRRGAADRTAAADGDKNSCQVTAYRHGGGPERLQCSRRARHSVRERPKRVVYLRGGQQAGPGLGTELAEASSTKDGIWPGAAGPRPAARLSAGVARRPEAPSAHTPRRGRWPSSPAARNQLVLLLVGRSSCSHETTRALF